MSNKSRLQYPNNAQFMVTLPKSIVLAKNWKKGDLIEFFIDDKGNLVLKKREKK